jgi:beta-hydroxylase
MRLFTPQFLLLWAFIGSAVAVHFRGKVRLGFWRQVADHSTIMAPYNVLTYMFSAVPNRPVLQQDLVPELAELRDNWQTIREEAQSLFELGAIKAADKFNDWGFNSFFRTGWKRFYL